MNQLKARALATVAQKSWGRNNRHKSVALLTKALARDPKNISLLADLATAHGKRRNYDEAEQLLARARKLCSRKAASLRIVAQAYATIDRPESAVECYCQSIGLNTDTPTTTDTLVELSSLYERRHRLDEAREAVEQALGRDPSHEQARLQQAVLDRRSGDLDQAERRLRSMVGGNLKTSGIVAKAWYELAQLLDKAKRYDDAFEAFCCAKRTVRPQCGRFLQSSEHMLEKNEEMLQSLSPDHFRGWQELAGDDTPYRCAVMTSHPRSGTTLAEQILDSHDQLKSADEFDVMEQWVLQPIVRRFSMKTSLLDVLEQVPKAVRQEARHTYWSRTESILDEPMGTRMLLDKNPALTFLLPIINWAFPEMKLLIALRDPRDVVLSCFMQNVPPNSVSAHWLSLEDTAAYYARMMNTWLGIREMTHAKWLEFRYEDTVDDLEHQARRLLHFLELPWDDKVLNFHQHAREKRVRSPTYEAVTKPIYRGSVGRWQNYAKQFEPLTAVLEPLVKEFGY